MQCLRRRYDDLFSISENKTAISWVSSHPINDFVLIIFCCVEIWLTLKQGPSRWEIFRPPPRFFIIFLRSPCTPCPSPPTPGQHRCLPPRWCLTVDSPSSHTPRNRWARHHKETRSRTILIFYWSEFPFAVEYFFGISIEEDIFPGRPH